MRPNIILFTVLTFIVCSIVSLFQIGAATAQVATVQEFDGIERIDVQKYKGCFEISNDQIRLVLGHHQGGRILIYERDGKNAMFLGDETKVDVNGGWPNNILTAGRFDVGPELLQTRSNAIWNGPWTAAATDDRQVTLTSVVDPTSGIQVDRVFQLHANSSRLTITQTASNHSDHLIRQCYWSRTFAKHGGVIIVPCDSTKSRLPVLYYSAPSGKILDLDPEDPAIKRVDDFLLFEPTPKTAKQGIDSVRGWVACQTRDNLLFVKRYDVFDDRKYGEVASINLSIWYPQESTLPAVEIEPIGPMQNLQPGESASFAVDWWLLDRAFPADGNVDPKAVAEMVEKNCVRD